MQGLLTGRLLDDPDNSMETWGEEVTLVTAMLPWPTDSTSVERSHWTKKPLPNPMPTLYIKYIPLKIWFVFSSMLSFGVFSLTGYCNKLIRIFHLKCRVYWQNSSKTVKIWMKKYGNAQSRKSECSNQEIIQKFCCLGQVANWWRTLSPLYKAPNQFWVSDTNISGFVRCSDFQPSLTFSDFLWKIPSYVPIKKTAPPQRGSFFRLTLGECHFRNFNTESEFWSLTPSRHLILWLKLTHDWLHDRPHDQSTDKEQEHDFHHGQKVIRTF